VEPSETPATLISQDQKHEAQSLQISHTEPENVESPSVTAALESMLGGLTPPTRFVEVPPGQAETDSHNVPSKLGEERQELRLHDGILQINRISKQEDEVLETSSSGTSTIQTPDQDVEPTAVNMDNGFADQQEAEFEIDSSPIQSSSEDDSDSDDSSSSGDSEGEDYKLLDPEEQARILMEGDGASDDEGGGKGAKSSGSQLRTKNEVPEEIIPKPDISITPEMQIEELGEVEAIVENILLIKAKTSGEYRVLESGSVLCLADRTVIGVVSETLGRVQQPLYSVRFTTTDEIAKAGLTPRTKVFYSERHSTYVFTQALKAYKGSDASNLHDEEVGDEEIEFSDDEAEAEHKRRIKQKKMEKRVGKLQQNIGSDRGGHTLQQRQATYDPMIGLSYDDEDDGPYKPLSRPAGFVHSVGRSEAPQEGVGYTARYHRGTKEQNSSPNQSRESYGRSRGRGDRSRGTGDRGRSNDRGRGRGGFQDRRNDGYSQPSHEQHQSGYSQPPQGASMPPHSPANNYNYYNRTAQDHYSPQQPHSTAGYHVPPLQQQQAYMTQQQYQYPQQYAPATPPQHGWPNLVPSPTMPAGAYINPAFFGNQQQSPTGQQWAQSASQHQDQAAARAFYEAQERLNILKNLSGNRGSM
jgi:H/ACA ribonucleoprotein complex non-core subunit NAF1